VPDASRRTGAALDNAGSVDGAIRLNDFRISSTAIGSQAGFDLTQSAEPHSSAMIQINVLVSTGPLMF
jgi:hypothetical protein